MSGIVLLKLIFILLIIMIVESSNAAFFICGVICSDKPGNHNFELLKKLVLPDGSVLRTQLPGRPTVDCLFSDPARDGIRSLASFLFACCTL